MKQMPHIHKFMTAMPHTIGRDIPIKKALETMRLYGIRHLPVLEQGELVGIITDRDVKLAASFKGADDLSVDDVMTPEPFAVVPEAALDQVVAEMAERKYGCAVVCQENGKVVGVFTATDGLRVFGEILKTTFKNDPIDSKVRAHS